MSYSTAACCCFAGRGRHHCPQPFLSQSSGYCNCLWTCITHVLLLLCRARKTPLSPALLVPIFWLLQLPMDMHYSCPILLLLCRARKTPLSPALLVPIFWLLRLPMDLHYSCPTAALPGEEDTIVPSPSCPNFLAIAIAYGHALLMSYCCFAGRGRHHCPQPFLSQSSGYCNCLWTCITHVLLYCCLLLLRRARKTPLSPALLVPIFWLLQLLMDLHYSCPTAALPGEEDTIVPSPSCPNLLAIAIAYGQALLMSSSTAALPARKTPLSPALLVPIFWLLRLPMDLHYSCPTAALPGEEDTIVPSPSCPNLLAIAIAYGPALLMSYCCFAGRGRHHCPQPFLSQFSGDCNCLWTCITHVLLLLCRARKTPLTPALLVPIFWLLQLPMDMHYSCPTAALPGEEDTIVPSPSCPNFLAIAIAYGHALLMSYCCFAGRGRHHCPQPFLSQSSGYCNCLWTCITHVLLYCCLLLLRRARKTPLSPALLVPIFWLLQLLMDLHYSCPTAALPGEEDTIVPSPSCPNLLAIAIANGQALLMSSSTAALPARKTPLSPALLVPIFWLLRLPMDLHYSCPTAALPGEEDTIVPSPSCPNLLAIAIAYGPALLMSYCCFAGRGRHHCPQPFLSQFSGDCNCLWTCITHVLLLLCRARKTPLTPALLVPIFWLLQLPMDMHYSCPTAALPGEEDTIVPSPSCPNFLAIAIAYGPALLMSYSTAALPGEEDTIVPSPSCPNFLAIAIAYGHALLMSYCCFAGRGRHHCPQPFLSQSSGYCNCLWTGITHVLLYCCLLLLRRARKTPLSPALLVPIFWLLQLLMDMHYSCPTAALPGEEDTIVPSPSCPNFLAIAIAYGPALLMSSSTAALPARKTPLSPALLVPIFWLLRLPMDLHYSCPTAALPGEEDTIVPSPSCPNLLAIAIAYGPALLMSYCCFAGRGRHHCPQPFLSQFSGDCNCLWTCITHVLLLLCRARKTPLTPALLVPIFWLLQLPMDMHYSCPTAALPGEEDTIVPSPSCPNFLAIAIAYGPALLMSYSTAALPGEEDTIVPSPSCPNFLAIAIAYGPALLMSYCCFAGQGRHH